MLKGHPKGLLVAFFANMGERFGYYTMIAIFVLFLQAKYGFEYAIASQYFGIFLACVYFLPLFGGIIADRLLGYGKTISLGLIVAARLRTEELADGVLNLMSWPMLLMSGVWFSMEGTSQAARTLSSLMPLTHLVNAARRVMIDGAGVTQVLPEIIILGGTGLILLLIAARLFRWN